jgi:acyl-CoA synthetase (AMP-forming)/AMP-acid ligase II
MSEFTVASVPRAQARSNPQRIALDDGATRLSYARLDARIDALARALAGDGVAQGDVVCAFLPNCIDYVIVVLAAARAGAVFCPINARYKAVEAAAILKQARPRFVFTRCEHTETIAEALARADDFDARIVRLDDARGGVSSLAALLRRPGGELPQVGADDVFSLMFTSGTTGQPKGALGTHRARMTWVRKAVAEFGLSQDDVYLGTMPQAHSAGLTFALMHLQAGATVRILPRFDPAAFLDIVERERVTSLLTVPTMLAAIVDELDQRVAPAQLASIRRLVSCGAPLAPSLKAAVLDRITPQLYDYYGATESNCMTMLRPADQRRKPASVGRPFGSVELMIADEHGEPCPTGTIGEVWSINPSAMSGYLGQPGETARVFRGRWYRTGDLGWLDDEGFLFLAGRQGDMVISGGINIHPAEIEQVLMLHPRIADAAVIGIPDERWGEVLLAIVVARERASITLADVRSHCREHLADYKKPRALCVVDALPKNAAGKTVRAELRALANATTRTTE